MIATTLQVYKDALDRGDMKIINTAILELRHSLHVYESYRAIRKVAIFGSARTPRILFSSHYQLPCGHMRCNPVNNRLPLKKKLHDAKVFNDS